MLSRAAFPPKEDAVRAAFKQQGLRPQLWSSPPGTAFAEHGHPYVKVLVCLRGSITFFLASGEELELRPGDRLDLERGTTHSALVGGSGVTCVEAASE